MSAQMLEHKRFVVYYDEGIQDGPKAEVKTGNVEELFTDDLGWDDSHRRKIGELGVDGVFTPWSPTYTVKVLRVK